ncbi:hypothetical protein CPB86DRAFT_734357 [Serendipita vermifera]|nr:hypothetical protein CPB86DRAFT_734357 [Serendipita vermifera]
MPPDMTENNRNQSSKLFGREREPKRPGDTLFVTDQTTAWEIYNHKASEVDREMIKDWNDSLNTLLIFTALYSAVLTAFIIESMKLLEEDPAETTRDILLIISRQLANSSFPAFEPTAYETPQYAIVVNGLFFTSLSCALIAALLAVLALQWVANYDMGLNTSSPKKRALQRHMRLMGIQKWKMSEIIASLPLLIFVALFLFFIGIADWLWHMNRTISGTVIGGIGIGCLLYTITTFISIVNLDAPFRTPVSKELAGIVRRVMGWLYQAITNSLLTTIGRNISDQDTRPTKDQQLTFIKREEKMFEGNKKGAIALDGLIWLANHIEISMASYDTFTALVRDLSEIQAASLMNEERIKRAPWKAIFEVLCSPYIGKSEYSAEELEKAMWICKGMGITPFFESRTFERFLGNLRNSNDRSISAIAYFKPKDMGSSVWEWSPGERIGKAFERMNESISHIGSNYLNFMLLTAKKEWPRMGMDGRTWLTESMARAWTISSAVIRDGSSSIVLPTDSIELIRDFMIPCVEVDTIDDRYLAATRPSGVEYWDGRWNNALCQVLRMMAQHLILHISHKYDSLSDFTKESKLLASFMDAGQLDVVEERDNFIWVILSKFTGETLHERQRLNDILCRGLYSRPVQRPWIDPILALENFVTRLDPSSFHFYPKAITFIDTLYKFASGLEVSVNLNPLVQVRDPCIAWIASSLCRNDVQFQALTHPNFSEWNTTIEQQFIRVFDRHYYSTLTILDSGARITFLRALILNGPSNSRIKALDTFFRSVLRIWENEQWHRLFASPVLAVVLEQSIKSEEFPIHSLLTQMAKFRWFYDEFSQANGLDWLPLVALNAVHIKDQTLRDNALAEILVDQLLSSTANQDIQAPLSSSYHYLQSIGQSHNSLNHYQLANLRTALLWILCTSTKAHDSQDHAEESSPLVFDPPVLERYRWPTVGDVRSFGFIKDLSSDEWEDWLTRLKILIMGASLGGLNPGPFQDGYRFFRGPDGCCGRI